MSIILTRTKPVLLSISNVQEAVLGLPRFWVPQSVQPANTQEKLNIQPSKLIWKTESDGSLTPPRLSFKRGYYSRDSIIIQTATVLVFKGFKGGGGLHGL